ncbi:MAG: HAMP domain-containing histidine kinase [Bdellovibrio sp.]|nr:HAMP domain-containing histidine kinase [Bdellovibrio sp.]
MKALNFLRGAKAKASFQSAADRRLRVMLGAQVVWLFLVFLIGFWWGNLLLDKSSQILALEGRLGLSRPDSLSQWQRTQRMIHWEGAFFGALVFGSTAVLFLLYWRDARRAKGIEAFFAAVTHELRTPLTSIRLQAESIADQLKDGSSQKSLVGRLLEDTFRLETQVERTLELARLEGGGPVYTQSLQLKPWMDRFLKNSDYSRFIRFDSEVEDFSIKADPVAMHVILKNLFENSIRHSGRENVLVKIQTVPLASASSKDEITLTLKDNGLAQDGLPKKLGILFNKGARSQGAGVGLYLVRTLMDRMEGNVEFVPTQDGFETRLTFRPGAIDGN